MSSTVRRRSLSDNTQNGMESTVQARSASGLAEQASSSQEHGSNEGGTVGGAIDVAHLETITIPEGTKLKMGLKIYPGIIIDKLLSRGMQGSVRTLVDEKGEQTEWLLKEMYLSNAFDDMEREWNIGRALNLLGNDTFMETGPALRSSKEGRFEGMLLRRIPGDTVDKIIARPDFHDVSWLRRMLFEVLLAMDQAQRVLGLHHYDLRLGNIMVVGASEAEMLDVSRCSFKIIDFGLGALDEGYALLPNDSAAVQLLLTRLNERQARKRAAQESSSGTSASLFAPLAKGIGMARIRRATVQTASLLGHLTPSGSMQQQPLASTGSGEGEGSVTSQAGSGGDAGSGGALPAAAAAGRQVKHTISAPPVLAGALTAHAEGDEGAHVRGSGPATAAAAAAGEAASGSSAAGAGAGGAGREEASGGGEGSSISGGAGGSGGTPGQQLSTRSSSGGMEVAAARASMGKRRRSGPLGEVTELSYAVTPFAKGDPVPQFITSAVFAQYRSFWQHRGDVLYLCFSLVCGLDSRVWAAADERDVRKLFSFVHHVSGVRCKYEVRESMAGVDARGRSLKWYRALRRVRVRLKCFFSPYNSGLMAGEALHAPFFNPVPDNPYAVAVPW